MNQNVNPNPNDSQNPILGSTNDHHPISSRNDYRDDYHDVHDVHGVYRDTFHVHGVHVHDVLYVDPDSKPEHDNVHLVPTIEDVASLETDRVPTNLVVASYYDVTAVPTTHLSLFVDVPTMELVSPLDLQSDNMLEFLSGIPLVVRSDSPLDFQLELLLVVLLDFPWGIPLDIPLGIPLGIRSGAPMAVPWGLLLDQPLDLRSDLFTISTNQ